MMRNVQPQRRLKRKKEIAFPRARILLLHVLILFIVLSFRLIFFFVSFANSY